MAHSSTPDRQLRVTIIVPLSGDEFKRAEQLTAVKPALDALATGFGKDATISHKVVAEREKATTPTQAAPEREHPRSHA